MLLREVSNANNKFRDNEITLETLNYITGILNKIITYCDKRGRF